MPHRIAPTCALKRGALLSLLLVAGACEARDAAPTQVAPAASSQAAPATPPASSPVAPAQAALAAQAEGAQPASARHFGGAPTLEGAPLPVAEVLASPEPHLGKKVKCEGKVARVCQRAGCWLELQAEGGGEGLRVPMAGHAFFIPQDAVGQLAVVEGELRRHELPTGQRAHYEGEGMKAVGPLSLEATSVTLR